MALQLTAEAAAATRGGSAGLDGFGGGVEPHAGCHSLTPPFFAPLRLPQDMEAQVARKKRRNTNKASTRSVGGASLEVIAKKKAEKPEARKASREAAMR